MNSSRRRWMVAASVAMTLSVPGLMAHAQSPAEGRFLRVVEEKGEFISLEVAARRYARQDGSGPEVCLVSVAHIGDASLYSDIQTLLDQFDVVLYESVKPAGAGRPVGDDDEARHESTRQSLLFIGGVLNQQMKGEDAGYPDTIEDFVDGLKEIDPRLAQWVALASVDAWGTPVSYLESEDGFTLKSFGADAAPDGEGAAADILVSSNEANAAAPLSGDDGLQAQLADALELSFQLQAVDYNREHFRCSDMTLDRLSRELSERDINVEGLTGALAGTSFSAQMANLILKGVKMADALFGGRVSDIAKLMMIEVLGNEDLTLAALDNQFGSGFADVIVGERNQVVMDDLAALIESEPQVASVAIFYGAAHMPDFETRLREQLGYEPSSVEWIPAMTLNFRESSLSDLEIRQMRMMMRRAVQQMLSGRR